MWLDSSIGVPIGAEVTVTDMGQLQLLDDDGKVRGRPPLRLSVSTPAALNADSSVTQVHKIAKKMERSVRPMHPSSVSGVDDMIRLGELSEEALLRNLLVRHKEGLIYVGFISLDSRPSLLLL